MQTIISQSSRINYHDDFYVNLEKAVPFNDMQRQLVNNSQFHNAINAKNANCLAINDKNANCHAHMFSGYAPMNMDMETQDAMCTGTVGTHSKKN